MNEIMDALTEWFDAEYYLRQELENGRTTEGSHYHRELIRNAEWRREAVADLIAQRETANGE